MNRFEIEIVQIDTTNELVDIHFHSLDSQQIRIRMKMTFEELRKFTLLAGSGRGIYQFSIGNSNEEICTKAD